MQDRHMDVEVLGYVEYCLNKPTKLGSLSTNSISDHNTFLCLAPPVDPLTLIAGRHFMMAPMTFGKPCQNIMLQDQIIYLMKCISLSLKPR